jgi:hypothetical protein
VMSREGVLRHGGTVSDLDWLAGPPEGPYELDIAAASVFNPGTASSSLLAIEKQDFERVGGFDDRHLPQRLYGLDLALRLEEEGLISVYTPHCALLRRDHREPAPTEELEYMWGRWAPQLSASLSYRWAPTDTRHQPPGPPLGAGDTRVARHAGGPELAGAAT